MRLSAFDTYCLYLALKNHFTRESYDFFKYNGKTSASQDSFQKRRDQYQFQKLSRKYSADEMTPFIVSNLMKGKSWVGDLLDEEADEVYRKHLKIEQSLSYVFGNELDNLFSEHHPSRCFKIQRGSYPSLLMSYIRGNVSNQTMIILDRFLNYIPRWDSAYQDDLIWSKHSLLLRKYAPFVEYDKTKLKNILKNKLKEYEDGEEQEARYTPSSQTEKAA